MMTTLNTMKWHKTPKKGSKGRIINRGKDNLTEKDRRIGKAREARGTGGVRGEVLGNPRSVRRGKLGRWRAASKKILRDGRKVLI